MTACDLWEVCSPLRANSDTTNIMLFIYIYYRENQENNDDQGIVRLRYVI